MKNNKKIITALIAAGVLTSGSFAMEMPSMPTPPSMPTNTTASTVSNMNSYGSDRDQDIYVAEVRHFLANINTSNNPELENIVIKLKKTLLEYQMTNSEKAKEKLVSVIKELKEKAKKIMLKAKGIPNKDNIMIAMKSKYQNFTNRYNYEGMSNHSERLSELKERYLELIKKYQEAENKEVKNELLKKIKDIKSEIKDFRKELKGQMKGLKDKIKERFNGDMSEYKNKMKKEMKMMKRQLPKEVKEKIAELHKEYSEKIKGLKEKYEVADMNKRKEIREKIKELHNKAFEKVKEKLQNNPELLKKMEEKREQMKKMRKEKMAQMEKIREHAKEVREQIKEVKQEMVVKFKKVIYKKFEKKINNFSLKKLEKINGKIDKAFTRIQNSRLAEEKKAKLLSLLTALKEVITEKIAKLKEATNDVSDEQLLDGLLK